MKPAYEDSNEINQTRNNSSDNNSAQTNSIPPTPQPGLIQSPENPVSPDLNNLTENPRPTSGDKTIGIIFSVIGVMGMLGVIFLLVDFYNKVPRSSGAPPLVGLILPLLFLYSAYYYLSGKNSIRIQRKVNKGLASKKKKIDKVQLLLAVIIISIIGYSIWYVSNSSNDNSVYNPETTSETDKTVLDEKRTEVANNIAAAEKEYQKNNKGGVKMGFEGLGIDLTDPATGDQYKFAGLLKDPSYSYLDSIHSSDSAKCAEDESGYMVETKDKNSFAFAIVRETMPPICFDFQGTLYL